MKKLLLLSSLLSLLLTTNVFAFSYADFVQLDKPADIEDMKTDHLQRVKTNPHQKITVDVYMRNFNSYDKKKVNEAKEILTKIMNSNEFKQRVLNFTFQGEKRFHENNGMSNQEIYDHLMMAEEDLMPGSTGVMNFDLTLYRSKNPFSKVKGYTLPDTMRIWMNKKFFRKSWWTAVDVSGNMAHEWVHKMGFGHAYRHNANRPYSVPYAIGNIVSELAEKMGYELKRKK